MECQCSLRTRLGDGCEVCNPEIERQLKAEQFVERYADGGDLCADCMHSDQSGPGWGHTCKVAAGEMRAGRPLDPTDCPALPDELYPEVTPNSEVSGATTGATE